MALQQMTKHPKRPRDLNQWAKRMVGLATGGIDEQSAKDAAEPKTAPTRRPKKAFKKAKESANKT
jgi:hypothetical protein